MSSTRFYRHYKNKPYKFLGYARHSETLEELALYETLYKNDLGTLWVRPKDMFFENVEIAGAVRPRFEKIKFEFRSSESMTEKDMEAVRELCLSSFGKNFDFEKFQSKPKVHGRILFQTAYDGDQLVGFKLGYAQDNSLFYSWLGAVLKTHQGLGVAGELMRLQHEWCIKNHFKKIETRTRNKFVEMIRLNLKFGFLITGTQVTAGNEVKIIFEKELK